MGKTRQVANLVSDNNIFVDVNADKVGIGTANATSKLTVSGDVSVSGVLTATSYGGSIGNATYAGYATTAGIATYATSVGIATYATSAGIATYAISAGVSTSVISGIASVTRLQVVGVSTFTGGPVLIGSGTSTGTTSQRLQVTGGAYVSDSVGIGTTNPSNTLTVVGTTDIQGAVETVSVASTYNLPSGRVILECNAQSGTVFTHNLANGSVGIVSLRNFPATKNSITTFTILFTQNSTGTANTTPATGIGTNIQLWPTGSSSGLTTSSRVSTASTITLPTTANDVDIVTFAVHYNGAGAATTTNYTVYGSDISSFRFGNIRP